MTIILGLLAIAAIIAGIIMTGVGQGKDSEEGNKKKGAMFLGISTVGFVLYVVIVRWYDIDGWAAILPQGVGMFIATLLLSIKDHPFNKYILRNVLAGIMWAIGNIGLLYGMCAIPCNTTMWDCERFNNFVLFPVDCTSGRAEEFLKIVDLKWPGLCHIDEV